MYLICGLGNPGSRFDATRHNVGFATIDVLAEKHGIDLKKLKFKGLYGEGIIQGEKVILLKPQTFMNLSGESVRPFVEYYKLPPEKLIVIQDDIDIPFAALRIRKKGSAGTHNGMKSIIQQLQRDDFARLKIGVGTKHPDQDLASFVLSNFPKEELKKIKNTINEAASACEEIISNGIEPAMNVFNVKDKSSKIEKNDN